MKKKKLDKTDFVTAAQILQLNRTESPLERDCNQSKDENPDSEPLREETTGHEGHENRTGPQVEVLLLPTQDSSSDDDSASDDDEDSLNPEKADTREALREVKPTETLADTATTKKRSMQPENCEEVIEAEFVYHDESQEPLPQKQKSLLRQNNCTPVPYRHLLVNADLVDTPSVNGKENDTLDFGVKDQSLMSQQIPNGAEEIGYEFAYDEESPELVTHKSRTISRKNVIMTQAVDHTPVSSRHLLSSGDELADTPSVDGNSQGSLRSKVIFKAHYLSPCQELMDTPVASRSGEPIKGSDDWVDTPMEETKLFSETQDDDAGDMFCAVCHCGDSNDKDPIVLCDGINNVPCSFAVHTSCYSLEPSVISLLDKWRCDPCECKRKAKSVTVDPKCFVCQVPCGALKRSSGASSATWIHPYCMTWSDDDATVMCDFCSFPGATNCGFASCSKAAHPHCARGTGDGKYWLTVVDTQQKNNAVFCSRHRHEKHSLFRWNHDEEESRMPKCFVLPSSRVVQLKSSLHTKRQSPSSDGRRPRKRLKKWTRCQEQDDTEEVNDAESTPEKNDKRQRVRENLAKRHRGMLNSAFIAGEADIDSDEDMEVDEEESELKRIDEEEELAALGFINDSSQLGACTQDDLDCIDPDDNHGEATSLHRLLDIENETKRQFATPIMNRRMVRQRIDSQGSDAWGASPNNGANRSSLKGLGNCHFIRSVIEHARQGGDAEDIEAAYHEMEQEVAREEEEERDEESQPIAPRGPLFVEYIPSDDEDDGSNGSKGSATATPRGGLTGEQKAAIERKRLEALARRQGQP